MENKQNDLRNKLDRNIAVLKTTTFSVEEIALQLQDDRLFGIFHILSDVITNLETIKKDMGD